MINSDIIEIDEFNPKTGKLKSLKIAKKLRYNIPETLAVKNISDLKQSQIDEFILEGWLLRECSTNKMFGQEIPVSGVAHTTELFFQKLIPSEFSGNTWSYNGKIYIEIIKGIGYGLNRAGFTPTTYSSVRNKIEAVEQKNEYEIRQGKLILKKCGEYSKPPKDTIQKLIEIAKSFPNEMIEWAYANKKVFFLESYNYPLMTKRCITGYLDKNSSIVFLPKAKLALWSLYKNKKAIIVKEGGYSSHLAVLCGIFNKPFVRHTNPVEETKKIKIEYAKLTFCE